RAEGDGPELTEAVAEVDLPRAQLTGPEPPADPLGRSHRVLADFVDRDVSLGEAGEVGAHAALDREAVVGVDQEAPDPVVELIADGAVLLGEQPGLDRRGAHRV